MSATLSINIHHKCLFLFLRIRTNCFVPSFVLLNFILSDFVLWNRDIFPAHCFHVVNETGAYQLKTRKWVERRKKTKMKGEGQDSCVAVVVPSHMLPSHKADSHTVWGWRRAAWRRQPMLFIRMTSGPTRSPCSLIKPQKKILLPSIPLSRSSQQPPALLLSHAIRHKQGWRLPSRSSSHLLDPRLPAGTTCATSPQVSVHISRIREHLQYEEGLCTFRHFSLEWTQITSLFSTQWPRIGPPGTHWVILCPWPQDSPGNVWGFWWSYPCIFYSPN